MPKNKSNKSLKIDVDNLLDQAMVLGSSLVYLAKDSGEAIVGELEKRELLSTDKGRKLARDIKDNFKSRKSKLHAKVKDALKKVIDDLGIATKEDLEKMKKGE